LKNVTGGAVQYKFRHDTKSLDLPREIVGSDQEALEHTSLG
jgi:hypothetical protein